MSRSVCAACWGALAVGLVACSGGGEQLPQGAIDRPGQTGGPDAAVVHPIQEGGRATCAPAETQDCVIDRGTFMGIHDCAKGTQICGDDSLWGDCIEL